MTNRIAALFVLLATLLIGPGAADATDEKARALVKKGALLLDVRTPEEYAAGHLDGAKNIPVQELDAHLGELGGKGRAIVVYCKSGHRSANAKRTLEAAGFSAVYDLGGMSSW